MPVAVPEPKNFPTYKVGQIRDQILQDWRLELRTRIDPKTGQLFTEDEIARAVQEGSRWWIEANATDQVALGMQQQGLTLADQIRIDRANTEWLRDYHGSLWGQAYLPATGGSGPTSGQGDPGTIYLGSTTIGDPNAVKATDPQGRRYQNLYSRSADGTTGTIPLEWIAIDTGKATNIPTGTRLILINPPLGNKGEHHVVQDFRGGTDAETDAEFARRLGDRIRNKPAAGNRAQMRSWARDSSNAIEDAFVYPCAQYAGSTLIAVLQKRSGASGPNARIPTIGTLSSATAYLVPPASPVVPARAHVLVTGVTPLPANLELLLSLPKNSASGWRDAQPWPVRVSNGAKVTLVSNSTVFRMNADTASPVTAPKMMVWNEMTSRFQVLTVVSVSSVGGGIYEVTHAGSNTIEVGDYVSPLVGRNDTIAKTVEAYFDSLGPGEVIDLANDDRAHRAFRYPTPGDEYPTRVGRGVLNFLQDALGAILSDSDLAFKSNTEPSIPAEVVLGPRMLVCGGIGVYPL